MDKDKKEANGKSKAFVFLEVVAGQAHKVKGEIKEKITKGLKECDIVSGQYDIIVILEAENLEKIHKIVYGQIQTIQSITKTQTHSVVNLVTP